MLDLIGPTDMSLLFSGLPPEVQVGAFEHLDVQLLSSTTSEKIASIWASGKECIISAYNYVTLSKEDYRNMKLMAAVKANDPEAIRAILGDLSEDEHLEALGHHDKNGQTVLLLAVALYRVKAIKALLKGLSSNAQLKALDQANQVGMTALIEATLRGKTEIILALLEGLSKDETQQALAQRGRGRCSHFTPFDACVSGLCHETTRALLASFQAPLSTDGPPSKSATNGLLHLRFGLKPLDAVIPSHVAYQSLSESFKSFVQEKRDHQDHAKLVKIEKAFSKTNDYRLMPAHEVARRILLGESVVIPTGWPGHSTAVVFANHGKSVLKCNRGARPKSERANCGISVFQSSSLPTLKELTEAIVMLRKNASQENFYQKLDNKLHLQKVSLTESERAFVKRKDQKFGNCISVTPKTVIAALMLLEFRQTPKQSQRFSNCEYIRSEITDVLSGQFGSTPKLLDYYRFGITDQGAQSSSASPSPSLEAGAEAITRASCLYKEFAGKDRFKLSQQHTDWMLKHPEAVKKTHRAMQKVAALKSSLPPSPKEPMQSFLYKTLPCSVWGIE